MRPALLSTGRLFFVPTGLLFVSTAAEGATEVSCGNRRGDCGCELENGSLRLFFFFCSNSHDSKFTSTNACTFLLIKSSSNLSKVVSSIRPLNGVPVRLSHRCFMNSSLCLRCHSFIFFASS
mmetsp:Transcript_50103/g.131770  ORF Transcript_50103/g.131770 Transcript_50103/m.131770 type:complete len:122 (-) Transcript_50103:130-495(-)